MLYSHQQKPIYLNQTQNIANQSPQIRQSTYPSYEFQKASSQKLDILFEQCLNKSNQIIEENQLKIQSYLSTKKSSQSIKSTKENRSSEKKNSSQITKVLVENIQIQNSVEILSQKPFENNSHSSLYKPDVQNDLEMENRLKTLPEPSNSEDNNIINLVFNDFQAERPIIESKPKNPKNLDLRLQLDELFEKCTKKTRECLETHQIKPDIFLNSPLNDCKYFNDGSFYRGALQNGQRFGEGVLYTALGKEIYKGNWINDKYDGHGLLFFENLGTKLENSDWIFYEGGFKNGKFEGLGKISLKNGDILNKNFRNGVVLVENDRLNTSLNRINEEEEEKNSENYEEKLEQYFKEEFEMEENNSNIYKEIEDIKRLTNDSHENLKELADNLCSPDEIGLEDLDFMIEN